MRLSEAEVAEFFDQGYLVREALFAPAELAPIAACFERLEAEAAKLGGPTGMHRGSRFVFVGAGVLPPILHRVVWAGALEPHLLRVSEDSRLTQPAAQLLGSQEIVQLLNQCHFKNPGDGVAFPWHQDSQNRRYGTPDWTDVNGRGSFVQAILAVDSCPPDSGPLVVFPGSCRHGHLGLSGKEEDLPSGLAERVTLHLPAGSVVFFGPYTIHGSAPNVSDRARRVLINGYACPGANRFVYPGSGTGRQLIVGALL